MKLQWWYRTLAGTAIALLALNARAGPSGSELDLGLMPAAGGMEGVGAVRPQDGVAQVFGNPATMTQLTGQTSFVFGASYVRPQLKSRGTFSAPGPDGDLVGAPFAGKSKLDDLAVPHAAVLQRVSPDLVLGMGLTGVSGLGSDFRNSLPPALSLIADLKLFGANMSAGYQLNDKLSVGGAFTLGIGSLQVGTVPSTASSNNFGVAGTFGFTYDLGALEVGGSYKTELRIKYSQVVLTDPDTLSDFTLTQPRQFKVGVATSESFMPGTLLAADFGWKNYSSAKGYQDFWRNQWRIALGAQQALGEGWTVRGGWSYSRSIAKKAENLGNSFSQVSSLFAPGFPDVGLGPEVAPVFPDIIQLAQTTIANGLWQQGVSAGVGYQLTQQIRVDVNVNYAFDGKRQFRSPIPGSPQLLNAEGSLLSAGMGISWNF